MQELIHSDNWAFWAFITINFGAPWQMILQRFFTENDSVRF
jgi:hypothetical protein